MPDQIHIPRRVIRRIQGNSHTRTQRARVFTQPGTAHKALERNIVAVHTVHRWSLFLQLRLLRLCRGRSPTPSSRLPAAAAEAEAAVN